MGTGYSSSTPRPSQNVRSSSSEAFYQKVESKSYGTETGQTRRAIAALGVGTRLMVSRKANIPINKICQYVKILLQQGIIQESKEKRCCKITGNKAYYLRITKEGK